MRKFLVKRKKLIYISTFLLVFSVTMVHNIPCWILANLVEKYSEKHLKLYDTQGTFWSGSGLLVAMDTKKQSHSSPLLYLDWHLSMGFKRFIDIKFTVGAKQIAEIYLNKDGVNVDNVDISLSISQVSQLLDLIHDLGVSGNLNVKTKHLLLAKKIDGDFKVRLDDVSSTISRVNPLGSYNVTISPGSGDIRIDADSNSVLQLSGDGSFNGLSLKARVREDKKEDMLQFMTAMGIPMPDGSYQLKIF